MFNNLGPAVKNIIIINVLVYLACFAFPPLRDMLSGYFYQSPNFRPWQLVTHMFTHAPSITHIFFNMYGLFVFGSALERYWGSKRFLIYYFVCGFGAFFLHEAINYIEIQNLISQLSAAEVQDLYESGENYMLSTGDVNYDIKVSLYRAINTGVVGASGCVFGVLLAFGMMFPNTELMLLFPPIPLKAKWFVMIYGAIELMLALQNSPGDNVAHYAHLGGMIFGFILLKIWKKRDGTLYGNNNYY